ncbi:MAG: serine/threonine-protein phosphatase [Candidatus Riflebacteria bacterium]|nr:serine/threonine-protein phosphatase [Candidatus Riflebacteria bacterium]
MRVFKNKIWLVLTFAGLIVFLGVFFHEDEEYFKEEDSRLLEKFENIFDTAFLSIEANSDPLMFFERILTKLEKIVFSQTRKNDFTKKLLANLKKRFPGVFEFTFVDSKGEVIPELCDSISPKAMIKRFFFEYQNFVSGKSLLSDRQRAFVQGFLGKFVAFNQAIHGKVIFATEERRKRFVFLSSPSSRGFFIVHMNQVENWNVLPLRDLIRRLVKNRTSLRFCFFDYNSNLLFPIAGFPGISADPKSFLDKIFENPKKILALGNYFFSARLISPKICLIARKRIPERFLQSKELWRVTKVAGISLILILLLVLYIFQEYFKNLASIKNKLLLIFLASAGIPVLIVILNAFSFLRDKKLIIESEVFAHVFSGLNKFDGDFQLFVKGVGKELSKDIDNLGKSESEQEVIRNLENFVHRNELNYVRLFDRRGKLVFRKEKNFKVASCESLFLDFGPSAVRIINRVASGQVKPGQKFTFESARENMGNLDSESLVFAMIASNLGSTSLINIGDLKIVLFSALISDRTGNPSHILFAFWEKEQFEELYIKKRLLQLWRQIPRTRVWVIWGNELEKRLPPVKKWPKEIVSFMNGLGAAGTVRTQIIKKSGGSLLLCGFRCEMLENRFLISVTSDLMIRRELESLKNKIFGLLFFTIVFAVSSAIFLSRRFINPASHLKLGIEMLRCRNFDFRSEILGSEEWIELLVAFNRIMDGMKELQVAKVLQEGFFPESALEVKDWRIHGSCIPTMQVGGDYFDYVPVGKNKALIILGDVAGHGVSAALVVAMAKALLSHPLSPLNPNGILEILNSVFFRTLRWKKTMTCVACLLDADEGKITISNAGQTYPLIIRDGKVIEMALPGLPLGIKRSREMQTIEHHLSPDDVLVFYTDGIVEYRDVEGEILGFKKFFSSISGKIGKTPQETEESLLIWLKSMTDVSPQLDDITLVICQKFKNSERLEDGS